MVERTEHANRDATSQSSINMQKRQYQPILKLQTNLTTELFIQIFAAVLRKMIAGN